jgi:hypothetical protein
MHSQRAAIQLSSFCLVSVLVSGPAVAAAKPWKPIQLERIVVGVSDVVPGPAGRASVGIPISSKSTAPVMVVTSLRPPPPAPECSTQMTIEAHRDTIVMCLQDAFAPGDYVISVAVLDSTGSDTLESGSTTAQFSNKDVKALGEWLDASTLPKAFKNIEKVDKVSAGTAMSSMFGMPHGDGTLTVDSTGVTYKTKKESIVIPASALRDVGVNNADPKQPWVVVSYEDAGAKKSVSFKPNAYRGGATAEQILAAIEAAARAGK